MNLIQKYSLIIFVLFATLTIGQSNQPHENKIQEKNTNELKYLNDLNELKNEIRILIWSDAYEKNFFPKQLKNLNSILPKDFLKKYLTILFVVYDKSSNERIVYSLINDNQQNYEFGNCYFVTRENFKNWTKGNIKFTPFIMLYKNKTLVGTGSNPTFEELKQAIEKIK